MFQKPALPPGIARGRYQDGFLNDTFPEGFSWGTSTCAYQIEGAHNVDGKGTSIWDTFSHEPGRIKDNSNGDVACDHYNHMEEDVELMKKLGVNSYRLSISWTRILPTGDPSRVNQTGINFYNRLFDSLLSAGITPCVTLYHWDLPQDIQDKGGWLNPEIVELFKGFARVCFAHFGDKVKMWITLNEPAIHTLMGYGMGIHAPGIKDFFGKGCLAGHHLILAHAKTYRLYQDEFKAEQNGKIGFVLSSCWQEPRNPDNEDDRAASERALKVHTGWFAWPVFKSGDYVSEVKQGVAAVCEKMGIKSTLPEFTEDEKALIKGSADFFGLNYYTTSLVWEGSQSNNPLNMVAQVITSVDPEWKQGSCPFFHTVPWGFRKMLNWLTKTFPSMDIYVTENGYADTGQLDDTDRVEFIRDHLNELLKAIRLDSANVKGYFAWSLMDNFEWSLGYTCCFGLYHVDFTDPKRKRTKKSSATFYKQIIQKNGFPKEK